MPGLSINQLVTVAIVAAVVFFSLKAGSGIASAADKIAAITGVELGSPSINSFTATPDGKGNMQFRLSFGGSKSDVELLIYQRYEPTPDVGLGAPDFRKENIVYHLIADSDATGQKLTGQLEKGVINQLCPQDASGTVGGNGCDASITFKQGGYRFAAVLKKKAKVVDSKDATTGFYDENYVELLDKTVRGCKDGFGDCNVVACKSLLINYVPLGLPLRFDHGTDVSKDISNEFRAERGLTVTSANPCGKFNRGEFSTDGCSKEDIDWLNVKVARLRMLEAAYPNTEADYSRNLNLLYGWKKSAVSVTMGCINGLQDRAAFGARKALDALGWKPVGKFEKEGKINAELDKALGAVRPTIANIKVEGLEGYRLRLNWELASKDGVVLGESKVKSYKISHSVKRWERKASAENPLEQYLPFVVSGQNSDGTARTSFETDAAQRTGKHEFEVSVFAQQAGEPLAKATASTGLFDDAYIETYKGGIDGCVTHKDDSSLLFKYYGKNAKADKLGEDCDVYALKRYTLLPFAGELKKRVDDKVAAYNSANIKDRTKCKDPQYKLLEGCTPEEVNEIYHNYLKIIGREDDYNCVKPFKEGSTAFVCMRKRQVVETLQKFGWKDLRVSKGWETNV